METSLFNHSLFGEVYLAKTFASLVHPLSFKKAQFREHSRFLTSDLRILTSDLRFLTSDLRFLASDLRFLASDLRFLTIDLRLFYA